ncbi:MAG: hypothetical protein V3U52_09020 [Thermoplasmata archaeon]
MAIATKSQEGLKLLNWSLLLYLVSLVVGLVGSVAFVALAVTGRFNPTTAFAFVARIAVPTVLLSLVLVILFFIGFFTLYSNRRELGPRHERNMERSFLLFIGIIVAFVAVQAVVFVMFFMAFTSLIFPFDPGQPPQYLALEELQRAVIPGILVGQGLDILFAFLVGLLLFFIVAALVTSQLQSRLKLAAALLVFGSVANVVTFITLTLTGSLIVPVFQNVTLIIPPPSMWYQYVIGSLLKSSLQIAAAFLFWRVYRTSYDIVRTTQTLAE